MSTPYEEAAPKLSTFVDEVTFMADFPPPSAPPPPAPAPIAAKKRALYDHVKAIYATGSRKVPLHKTAATVGVPVGWVKIIVEEITAALAVVHAVEPE